MSWASLSHWEKQPPWKRALLIRQHGGGGGSGGVEPGRGHVTNAPGAEPRSSVVAADLGAPRPGELHTSGRYDSKYEFIFAWKKHPSAPTLASFQRCTLCSRIPPFPPQPQPYRHFQIHSDLVSSFGGCPLRDVGLEGRKSGASCARFLCLRGARMSPDTSPPGSASEPCRRPQVSAPTDEMPARVCTGWAQDGFEKRNLSLTISIKEPLPENEGIWGRFCYCFFCCC
ncbi:uncharacterized protein [Petaurus breviceps papuanus]|uniref:uncharacterized protein n=1 Tax=Petaurus breviceps papuanus TaxID=3040969 RepID=UPI0036DBA08E